MSGAADDPVWLFDCKCVLCSWGVRYTLKHEKAATIRFVAIQSDEGRTLAMRNGIDPADPATFLFVENGEALEKSDAVIALSKHLSGPARLLSIASVIPRRWRDAAYSLVARNRYRLFGKTSVCIAPGPETRRRFVLR